jgi:hypothetical protein
LAGEDRQASEPAIIYSPAHLTERVPLVPFPALAESRKLRLTATARRLVAEALDRKESSDPRLRRRALVAARDAVAALAGEDQPQPGADDESQSDSDDMLLRKRLASLLREPSPSGSLLHPDDGLLPGSSTHDFSEYMFLRDPDGLLGASTTPGGTPVQSLDEFLAKARQIIHDAVWAHCWAESDNPDGYTSTSFIQYFPGFEDTLYKLFLAHLASPLFQFALVLVAGYEKSSGSTMQDVLLAFEVWISELCAKTPYKANNIAGSFDDPARWESAGDEAVVIFKELYPDARQTTYVAADPKAYSFLPYSPFEVNFGIRVVYRQDWRPLGNQPGEVIRTIPLGPKQVEKVSTKVVTTTKLNQTNETMTSTETSTESATTTKDSSDVVRETSDSFKWHVDAEAGGQVGAFTAKLSAGAAGEMASNSKDTKSRLNESTSKSASRTKRDVKILITTEQTVTDETSRTSEISNPNDEIAVTYVYSKLQRQYEIETRMAEVNSVVFVPEEVPAYEAITTSWVQRNAWIIGRVLLDTSFVEDLSSLTQEPDDLALPDDKATFLAAMTKSTDAIAEYKVFTGGYMPDLLGSGQQSYERYIERARGSAAEKARKAHRRAALIDHIRRNILHYMRAIWASEDSDQRRRRYDRILVPTQWSFAAAGVANQPGDPVPGRFEPVYSSGSLRPLTEIIHPAGPIGYVANYAVFLLRGDPRLANLHEALATLRASFVRYLVNVDPGNLTLLGAAAFMPRHPAATYEATFNQNWSAARILETGQLSIPVETFSIGSDFALDIEGVRVWLNGVPSNGTTVRVQMRVTDDLEDPALRVLRYLSPAPHGADEATVFTDLFLDDMWSLVPELGVLTTLSNPPGIWGKLSTQQKNWVRTLYHTYLLRRDSTKRFVLDTNNVVLNLEVGDTPALEEFKRLHRYLDVLTAAEERIKRKLENERRQKRLNADDYGDPDIEKVVVMGSANELRAFVGSTIDEPVATGLEGDGSPERVTT